MLSNQNSFEWELQQQTAQIDICSCVTQVLYVRVGGFQPVTGKIISMTCRLSFLCSSRYLCSVRHSLPYQFESNALRVFPETIQKWVACNKHRPIQFSVKDCSDVNDERIACVNLFNGLFQSTYHHDHYANNNEILESLWCILNLHIRDNLKICSLGFFLSCNFLIKVKLKFPL